MIKPFSILPLRMYLFLRLLRGVFFHSNVVLRFLSSVAAAAARRFCRRLIRGCGNTKSTAASGDGFALRHSSQGRVGGKNRPVHRASSRRRASSESITTTFATTRWISLSLILVVRRGHSLSLSFSLSSAEESRQNALLLLLLFHFVIVLLLLLLLLLLLSAGKREKARAFVSLRWGQFAFFVGTSC